MSASQSYEVVIAGGGLTIEDPRHVALVHALLERSVRAYPWIDGHDGGGAFLLQFR